MSRLFIKNQNTRWVFKIRPPALCLISKTIFRITTMFFCLTHGYGATLDFTNRAPPCAITKIGGGAYRTRSYKHKCLTVRHSYVVRRTAFANNNSLSNLSLLTQLGRFFVLTSAFDKIKTPDGCLNFMAERIGLEPMDR